MTSWRRRGLGLLAFLSIGVALVAPALWLFGVFVDEPDQPPLVAHLVETFASLHGVFLAHVIGGGIALLAGPWQLMPRWRAARPGWHRRAGYIYTGAVLVAGGAGLVLGPRAWGGLAAQSGFTVLAAAWLATTAAGVRSAIAGDLRAHRAWMTRSFALTFAAVTLRLQVPLLGAIGVPEATAYALVAWSSWVPNLVAVEWWARRARARRPAGIRLATSRSIA